VALSVTTLDADLAGKLEPRASRPAARLSAIAELAKTGVPVGVMVAPIIPGLNDHEIPAILEAVRDAGARFAGYTMVRLPGAVAELFQAWLAQHYPQRREKVLGRIRGMRGGRLNDPRMGSRMRGEGAQAELVRSLFKLHRNRLGLNREVPELSTASFRRPGPAQASLFASF
jgi:DNA repair photolyase